ncbi:AAA family ATPase [Nannocystis pusilla]|uniref:AAA family ATPase n=1 Tax=Nannocystis pusilla TaxID=889268 RepID=UPI003BF30584
MRHDLKDTPFARARLRLREALQAGARGLGLRAVDEARALRLCEDVGERLDWPVHTWSAAGGRDGLGAPEPLADLLRGLLRDPDPGLWVLLDPPPLEPVALRALRELAQRSVGPAVVVVGDLAPALVAIPELELLELELPDADELTGLAADLVDELRIAGRPGPAAALDRRASQLAHAALGLSEHQARRLLRRAAHVPADDAALAELGAGKAELLRRGGLLERVEPVPSDMLGGLAQLKQWLARRALALRPEARAAAIPDPRGVLLVGVQGCGKSLAARVCAHALGLGLLRLEPGRLYGGTLGESEANLRRVTATVERIAPVALWIDELDKGLAGSEGPASDAGTAARVLGGLLTWLQERRRPVFVVATANQVTRLPPELTRRGRLDEIFFVDLPDADERAAIAEIHLEHAPRSHMGAAPVLADPLPDLVDLVRAADGLSGAEIEGAIVEARLDAFAESRPLARRDLARALAATIPLSRSRAGEITALRAWASAAARRA